LQFRKAAKKCLSILSWQSHIRQNQDTHNLNKALQRQE